VLGIHHVSDAALHLDAQDLRGREPEGFLTDCLFGDNRVEGYHLTRPIGHEFVRDLWVDGACGSFANLAAP
jgi:hypothetical protein